MSKQEATQYRLHFREPHRHFIDIELDLPANGQPYREVRAPKWRPGRYELGPYVQNIVEVGARSASGQVLEVSKTAYNHWRIATPTDQLVTVSYRYYAVALDAGGSCFDEDIVYINGVNLFLYEPDRIDQPCEADIYVPEDMTVACGLRREGHRYFAEDFHQLVDAPLLAGRQLQHKAFEVAGHLHHIWMHGHVQPDWARIERDFTAFGRAQCQLFGDFPVQEYHYLFLLHDKPFYHGVEHHNSTVITLGPAVDLMGDKLYEEVLGISSHELFHTWNVKALRPVDMVPYDYDRENYSELHYVTEGVTTYYGDLMLLKSGVWTLDNFLKVFNNSILRRHYDNQGQAYVSLTQSSFDSWLVGYKAGVPNRKISFYTKGALAAFVLDVILRKATHNAASLDQAMRVLYERFQGKGYSRSDYQCVLEEIGGVDLKLYFKEVVDGTNPLEPYLIQAADYLGLELAPRVAPTLSEKWWGMILEDVEGAAIVKQVHEGSPADRAGMRKGDELIAVGGMRCQMKNFESVLAYHAHLPSVEFSFFRKNILERSQLERDEAYWPASYLLQALPNATEAQRKNREMWMTVQ